MTYCETTHKRCGLKSKAVMDFPEAWAFVQSQTDAVHDPRCSYLVTNGALLCDCRVLWDEYDRRKASSGEGVG